MREREEHGLIIILHQKKSAVLSSIFLKERLSFQGKVGCLQCVLGAIIIVMHAPEQGAADTSIETFKHLMLSVGKTHSLIVH